MSFSNKLREIRLKRNMTEKQLAELIGIQLRTYKNYETGKTIPRIQTLRKLSITLNISSDELLELDFELYMK